MRTPSHQSLRVTPAIEAGFNVWSVELVLVAATASQTMHLRQWMAVHSALTLPQLLEALSREPGFWQLSPLVPQHLCMPVTQSYYRVAKVERRTSSHCFYRSVPIGTRSLEPDRGLFLKPLLLCALQGIPISLRHGTQSRNSALCGVRCRFVSVFEVLCAAQRRFAGKPKAKTQT
jgi:hypothetical protein